MELRALDINSDPAVCQRARQLYLQAFPKEERLPWWVLRLQAKRRDIDLTAWMEGGTFCGFTCGVTVEGLHFLLFFAVAEPERSRGYGSAVLKQLREKYGSLVLNVETLEPEASNYAQRLRRLRFYQRNGLQDTGWFVWEVGGRFRVLCTEPELDVKAYRKIFRRLTLGIWRVKLKPDSKGAYYMEIR